MCPRRRRRRWAAVVQPPAPIESNIQLDFIVCEASGLSEREVVFTVTRIIWAEQGLPSSGRSQALTDADDRTKKNK